MVDILGLIGVGIFVWLFAEIMLAFCVSDLYDTEEEEYLQPAGGFLRAYLRKRRDH